MSQRVGISGFSVAPFNDESESIFRKKDHVVLGVSPGNSYFRVSLLTGLLGWLCRDFARVDVVVPDSSLVHTYAGLGYPRQRAEQKAHAEIRVLHNRVVRAWSAAGGPRRFDGLHLLSDLASGSAYRSLLASCEEAVTADSGLRDVLLTTSRQVLERQAPPGGLEPDQIERAARYLIAELPFFLGAADIFDAPSSLCFYHQKIPLAEFIFSRRSQLRPSTRQAYAVIRPEPQNPPAC